MVLPAKAARAVDTAGLVNRYPHGELSGDTRLVWLRTEVLVAFSAIMRIAGIPARTGVVSRTILARPLYGDGLFVVCDFMGQRPSFAMEKEAFPMGSYADYFAPGLHFVTGSSVNRERVLDHETKRHLLRSVLNGVKAEHPFSMVGYVFLPDHWHMLIRLQTSGTLDAWVSTVVRRFNRDYRVLVGMPPGTPVWERRYSHHTVHHEADFANRLDYIHYDPVHHGWVERPEEWFASSYETWVERGVYELGWGWRPPQNILGKNWG